MLGFRNVVLTAALLLASSALAHGSFAQTTSEADPALVAKGHAIAIAGDCAACHGDTDSGGMPIESPMGAIYASNITPDPVNGIGTWTLAQFADALRRGRSPDKGWLYPAMPYTSYTGMSDADIKALYSYLKLEVKPQPNKVPETKLPFPYFRMAMIGWNWLNLRVGHPSGEVPVSSAELKRGQYLAETLGHCSTCHTPRNFLMGEIGSKHLAGGWVGTWIAPNITPAGIGSWTNAQLVQFLKTGSANGDVAAGDMGVAVEHSFSHMSDADLNAMVDYLRQVPSVGTSGKAPLGIGKLPSLPEIEKVPGDWKQKIDASTVTDGGTLYQSACASCHEARGQGTSDGVHPSLIRNSTARALSPDNLVLVIANGVNRKTPGDYQFMPGFQTQMSRAQMAALATYIRTDFANVPNPQVTEADVDNILAGKAPTSWIIANAANLAYASIALGVVVIVLLLLWFFSRKRKVV